MSSLAWLGIALGIIAVIVIFILFVRFLLSNWIIAKSISAICSVIAIVCGFSAIEDHTDNPVIWPLLICSVLAYLFAAGEMIFDSHYEGTFSFSTMDTLDFDIHMSFYC